MISHDKEMTVAQLKKLVSTFVQERDWQQFHTPKNISMALSVEAAELMELFLWTDTHEGKTSTDRFKEQEEAIKDEVADIVYWALAFCNVTEIDLAQAIAHKMEKNKLKYPAATCKELGAASAFCIKDKLKKL